MAYDEQGNAIPETTDTESSHPVLQQLKDEIIELTSQLEACQSSNKYYSELATTRANETEITELVSQLEACHSSNKYYSDLATTRANETYTIKNSLKDVLIEKVTNGELDSEVAKEIAEACGVEVTRNVTITGTISFSGDVDVSFFDDIDDVRYNVNIDSLDLSFQGEYLTRVDVEVEDAEITTS